MRKTCALLALFFWTGYGAAAVPLCEPKTAMNPAAVGSAASSASSPTGDWMAMWCPTGKVDANNKPTWSIASTAVLAKYRGLAAASPSTVLSVVTAADPLAALNTLIDTGRILPAPGSQDEYEWKMLFYRACQAAALPPYFGAPIDPLPANYCGNPPVPPAPPVDIYKAFGSLTLYTQANGRLTSVINGRKAPANAECGCSVVKIPAAAANLFYCPLATGPVTEVTQCKKVP